MDIVDTFNHLIPSDQLDDSLLIGQNLECDASNEFGTLVQLEDSLRNMLSDKDPMLGSASCSQFDLLDNEDSSFQIAGPTGLEVAATDAGLAGAPSGELKSTETAVVKRPVGRPRKKPRHPVESEPTDGEVSAKRTPTGRPGRKPVNRLQKSFLIEKGVTGADLKKELTLGGRINISDLDVGLWINPVVVLKRLTVTVGGFRIELLPGPSYAANAADAGQSVCFEDSFSYCGDIQYAMLQDDAQEDAAQENQTNLGGVDNISTEEEDVPLGLGPYVNPNEVQAANGALMRSPCAEETKPDNQSGPTKHKPVGAEKDGVKQPQNTHGIKTDSNSKDKEKTLGQKQLKSKQALTPLKSKNSSSSTMKGPKSPQNKPSKITHAPAVNRGKTLNEKDVSLKRHGEELQNEHAPKVQKMQDKHANKVKPKSPGASSGGGKKSPSSSDSGHAEPQGPTKNSHVVGPKPESSQPAHGATGHSSRSTEDGGQEKSKVKKPEKILQRQKSKTVRSLSVDEPQLFIPDNAPPPPPPPVVKKETVEDQTTTTAASSDTAWEGNNCGLCKKHHNNTFMVGCGRCDDWFHGDCVGLDLTKVREMEEEDQMYVCLKCCAEEPDTPSTAKPEGQAKPDAPQDHKAAAPPPKPRPGQLPTSPGARPVKKESERKQSTEGKDTSQKTAVPPKLEMKKKTSSPGVKKPASVDEIRRSVRDSLKEILLQRLKDSDLKITSEKASEVAKKTERELFHLYRDTDSKYKNKYRSLMFNLKDTKNNVLFKRVLKAEISPAQLIRMSPEELASKELAAWRKRENRHTIEMIEKQEREVERRPITKITHKGEIEIESQEPAKTSEIVEPEPAPKVTEALLDHLLPLEKVESAKTVKDTTAQHKSHLFDLHCKICTGRMAPPVEEAPTKVVATTVVRRQSAPSEDPKVTTPPVKDEDLHLTVLEESFLKAKSFVSEGRSEFSSGRAEEAAFLSTLDKLWRGFINMPAVAKLVTKVFPVSGILDNLTEDLPDSIQVGGRISPQIVWDYLEKIRATGTKEVCLVRFSPETEEDEISYTLLFAYFSSRKRFGVVANNKKKVKDMYIIPLGATEKVPHQLVPFDGPGLENNRCNLLLALIIRQGQGPKKDFLPVDMNETARIVIPEIKKPQQSVSLSTQEIRAVKQEEKRYLTSLAPPAPAKEDKLLNAAEDADEPVRESFEEASAAEEGNNQESNKPLRFLPGVLVGWGGELPPLPDFGLKPKPAVDHSQGTQQPAPTPGTSAKSPTAAGRLDRFVIKKREPKPVQAEPGLWSPTGAPCANISAVKEAVAVNHGASVSLKDKAVAVNQGASVSLKDKPPDMSTEAFLASLSTAAQGGNEAASVVAAKTGEVSLPPETPKSNADGNSLSLSKHQATSDQTNSLKPPISGILKKCSAYSNVTEEKRTEVVVPEATANNPAPFVPQPVPVLTSVRHDPAVVSRQEAPQSTLSPTHTKREGASVFQASVGPAVAPTTLVPSAQQPQAVSYAATHTETTGFQYESPTASIEPTFSDAAPVGPTFSTAAPVETTFSNVAPVETTFSTAAPVEPTFSNVAPVETTFSNVAPVDPTFSNVAPVEPTFSNTAAVDPTLSDAATVEPTFSNAATVEPTFSNAATVDPTFSNAAPFPAQQPQVPGSFVYPGGPPPNVIPPPHLQDQNHAPPWAQDRAMPPHTAPPPGPLSPYADSYPPNELPLSSARDYKRSSDEYSDPWERPRHPEDRDHHGRHRHHSESRHGKKSSRHHSRERGKKHERGGHEDKYRDGSRQSGHTDDRHGERRKERHHSDEYRSKEKDRHRHRRDSDYENGRRNSKDL